MAFALRQRNLTCFYCRTKSSQKRVKGVQQWRCTTCEAVNYLDKNGQIADPPASSTPDPSRLVRYARSLPVPAAQDASAADVFCSTCLKNQHLLKETLSSYLPPEDNPNFRKYASSYEDYREELERRYPQVCATCAPMVRRQIRKATYVAKTDHLRRMMDRTKQFGVADITISHANSIFLRCCGLVSRASTLVEAGWHAVVALSLARGSPRNVSSLSGNIPLGESNVFEPKKWELYRDQILAFHESHALDAWMPLLLFVSLLTVWWNPHMHLRHLESRRKPEVLTEYYLIQVVVLLVRVGALNLLGSSHLNLSKDVLRGGHIFMAVILLSSIVISAKAAQPGVEPRFTFPAKEDPILPDIPPPAYENEFSLPNPNIPHDTPKKPFQINQLSQAPILNSQNPHSLTPPPDADHDPDSMDWSPSVKQTQPFDPNPRVRLEPLTFDGPSPFHGTLPPAPIAPSHKLRNPSSYKPGVFRKATTEQQSNFATRGTPQTRKSARLAKQGNPDDSDGTEMTTDNEDDAASIASSAVFSGQRRKHDLNMANPSFFPPQDQRDTGLEDLFGGSFDLKDTPKISSSRFAARLPDQELAKTSGQHGERWGGFGDVVGIESSQTKPIPADGRLRLLSMAIPAAVVAIGAAVWGATS